MKFLEVAGINDSPHVPRYGVSNGLSLQQLLGTFGWNVMGEGAEGGNSQDMFGNGAI